MLELAVLTALLGVTLTLSAQQQLTDQVKRNLSDRELKIIEQELENRELAGVILILVALMPLLGWLTL